MLQNLIFTFLFLFSTVKMLACDSNKIILSCTIPITEIEICVSTFCKLDAASATINDAESAFNCSLNFLPDNCITYTPLPGVDGGVVDTILIYASDDFAELDTVVAHIRVAENCADYHYNLFPYNQEAYYNSPYHHNFEGYDGISYLSVDSVKDNVEEKVSYINSKYLPAEYKNCLNQKYDTPIDSLVLRNDTIFYKVRYKTIPFYFLPKAKLGESWYIKPEETANKIDSIKITFETTDKIEFLGLTDSVKIYSYEAIGIHKDSTIIDEQQMLLSKNYGLLEYLPFDKLVGGRTKPNYFNTVKLLGLKKDDTKVGYELPTVLDFLPYHKGAVLFWKESLGVLAFEPSSNDEPVYLRDSITQVIKNEDSLFYYYNREYINDKNEVFIEEENLMQSFVYKHLNNIIGAKPNLYGYGKGLNNFNYEGENDFHIWNFINHYIDDAGNRLLICNTDYFKNVFNIDSCSATDSWVSKNLMFNSVSGLINHEEDYFESHVESTDLIGFKINGEAQGTLDVILDVNEPALFGAGLKVYPNPVDNYLQIENLQNNVAANYQITNIAGQKVLEGQLKSNRIEVNEIKAGIYFLNVQTIKNLYTIKFIKT